MNKAKILFISQEMTPYLPESEISVISRNLPQGIQELGKEIRTFMPRYGKINERRHQLHEVIRLSGMNLIIDDTDHPLIIKVASIQQARMQVYFIENEDFFHRKFLFRDGDGKFFNDNDQRAVFFAKGVLETVKKLGWAPDVVHVHGWFTGMVPFFIKTAYRENPIFTDAKIIVSLYDEAFDEKFDKKFHEKVVMGGVSNDDLKYYKDADYVSLMQGAIDFADAFIMGHEKIDERISDLVKASGKPVLEYQGEEDYFDAYDEFYDKIIGEN
jgi:starch synthase